MSLQAVIPKQLQESGIYPSRRPRFSIAETGLYSETNMADAGGRKDWDAGEEKNRFLKLFRYKPGLLQRFHNHHPIACKINTVVLSIILLSSSLALATYVLYGFISSSLELSYLLYYSLSSCSLMWLSCKTLHKYNKISSGHLPDAHKFSMQYPKALRYTVIALFCITLLIFSITSYLLIYHLASGQIIPFGFFSLTLWCAWLCLKTFTFYKKTKLKKEELTLEKTSKNVKIQRFMKANPRWVKISTLAIFILSTIAAVTIGLNFLSLALAKEYLLTGEVFSMAFVALFDVNQAVASYSKLRKHAKVENWLFFKH